MNKLKLTSSKRIILENKCRKLEQENSRLIESLDRIANPIWWMQEDQKRKTGSINGINGAAAIALSESADYLKGIAKNALFCKGKK